MTVIPLSNDSSVQKLSLCRPSCFVIALIGMFTFLPLFPGGTVHIYHTQACMSRTEPSRVSLFAVVRHMTTLRKVDLVSQSRIPQTSVSYLRIAEEQLDQLPGIQLLVQTVEVVFTQDNNSSMQLLAPLLHFAPQVDTLIVSLNPPGRIVFHQFHAQLLQQLRVSSFPTYVGSIHVSCCFVQHIWICSELFGTVSGLVTGFCHSAWGGKLTVLCGEIRPEDLPVSIVDGFGQRRMRLGCLKRRMRVWVRHVRLVTAHDDAACVAAKQLVLHLTNKERFADDPVLPLADGKYDCPETVEVVWMDALESTAPRTFPFRNLGCVAHPSAGTRRC